MKLDYDCLRSLLLKLEDFENLDDDLHYQYMTLDDMWVTQIQSAFFIGFHCFTPPRYHFSLRGDTNFPVKSVEMTALQVLLYYEMTYLSRQKPRKKYTN